MRLIWSAWGDCREERARVPQFSFLFAVLCYPVTFPFGRFFPFPCVDYHNELWDGHNRHNCYKLVTAIRRLQFVWVSGLLFFLFIILLFHRTFLKLVIWIAWTWNDAEIAITVFCFFFSGKSSKCGWLETFERGWLSCDAIIGYDLFYGKIFSLSAGESRKYEQKFINI